MKKRVLIVLLCFVGALSSAFAAEKKVQGVVISSEDNLPLIGASVYVTAEDLKKAGSAQTTMGVITDVDGQSEILVGFQEIENLFPEMMDVDDQFGKSRFFQFENHMLQHGTSGHRHQGFGHVVGQWFEPGTQSGGKYHGFHLAFSNWSICCSR